MRRLLCFFLLALQPLAQALSSTGERLLVVLEAASEKDLFSKFWGDLEGEMTYDGPAHICHRISSPDRMM